LEKEKKVKYFGKREKSEIDSTDFRINKIIKYLIFGDLVFEASWRLISPVFAIFVVEKIVGGSLAVVGLASTIYLILFSFVRIPFSIYLDKRKGESDDFWSMFFGFLISSFLSFFYIFSKFPWQNLSFARSLWNFIQLHLQAICQFSQRKLI